MVISWKNLNFGLERTFHCMHNRRNGITFDPIWPAKFLIAHEKIKVKPLKKLTPNPSLSKREGGFYSPSLAKRRGRGMSFELIACSSLDTIAK